jgi:hypothetical protein
LTGLGKENSVIYPKVDRILAPPPSGYPSGRLERCRSG